MIATGHSAIGFIVRFTATKITNDPITGLAAAGVGGVVAHYATDFIPHGHYTAGDEDPYANKIIILDVLGGTLLFVALAFYVYSFSLSALVVLVGIGACMAPDVLAALIFKVDPKRKHFLSSLEYKFHDGIMHWHGHDKDALPISPRDLWQLGIVAIALILPFV